ncbi:hypothetical protein I2494_20155 [Budviciaceae bacterium BWR-B9]|uniref:Uncharacterized protein n=1 Tax=Limnobaculum allomyrinae TaxID=2791986 RepID=A0ABS1IW45_9GAMM|nr:MULTISPECIES: hypothetical protein [Limnobaculum]MBK5145985.1 hypothetical protein [Limnobaculum allomyrinae]MBV7694034.1 hypothetical protein [Limnobaculum sp. M2-1]
MERDVDFVIVLTFDANQKHSDIYKYLEEHKFSKKSLSHRDLPNNTYILQEKKGVEYNSNGTFNVKTAEAVSNKLALSHCEKLKGFFEENGITGKIHAFVSRVDISSDSVSTVD